MLVFTLRGDVESTSTSSQRTAGRADGDGTCGTDQSRGVIGAASLIVLRYRLHIGAPSRVAEAL